MEQQRTLIEQGCRERSALEGASTFGWDTSFTTTYEVVNREIREKSTYPATFSNETDAHALLDYLSGTNIESYYQLLKPTIQKGRSVKLTGSWGQWQLDLRGNGNSIYMKLPVTSGKIALGDMEGSLDGGYIIAEVTLQYEDRTDETSPQKRLLTLTAAEQSQVCITDHFFPGLDPDGTLELLVEGTFKKYFNTEKVLKQFRYVFSTVNISDRATGDFAWLKPSDTGYAVFVPEKQPTESESMFSILCVTEGKTAPSYIQQSVDASIFHSRTKGTNAVLCISPQNFCKNLLITAATKMMTGTSEDDFTYSSDGLELHNRRQITFKDVEVSKGERVDLSIKANNFSIRLVNDHLELGIINASYSKPLYNAYLTLHQKIAFDTKKVDNKTVFTLREGEEFNGELSAVVEPSMTSEILKWVGVALDILSAVLIIGSGTVKLLAKCTTTAASATATISNAVISSGEAAAATTTAVEGIAAGAGASRGMTVASKLLAASSVCAVIGLPFTLIEAIAVEIGKNKFDNVPSLEDFARNFVSEIAWTGIEKTTLLSARLSDALLMDFKLE